MSSSDAAPRAAATVRPAGRADADALLTLIDALADYEKLARPDEAARGRLIRDAFESAAPPITIYLAESPEHPGAPVGYAIVLETYSSFLARPTLYLEDLFVLPEARRMGAGSALFRYCAAEAVRRGCGRMEWVCLDWNELAIGFYEQQGATHLDDWRTYRLDAEALERFRPGTG
jgi:GNAT superfamily N-acetyltransferase